MIQLNTTNNQYIHKYVGILCHVNYVHGFVHGYYALMTESVDWQIKE